jgi:hypothetical protein
MKCSIRIIVECTARLDGVDFFHDGNQVELEWTRTASFTKFTSENYEVNGSGIMAFGLTVLGFHKAKYDYTIERFENATWSLVDKDSFTIGKSGSHSFEKTIDLLKGSAVNALTKPIIA